MGTGQRWHVVSGVDEGDERHSILEGGRKWPKLLHMAKKHLKNINKTREKHVEKVGEIRKGERVRGEQVLSSLGARVF
jgi:hypothetical protein